MLHIKVTDLGYLKELSQRFLILSFLPIADFKPSAEEKAGFGNQLQTWFPDLQGKTFRKGHDNHHEFTDSFSFIFIFLFFFLT